MQMNSHMFKEIYKDLDIDLNKLGCVMVDLEPRKSMLLSEESKKTIPLHYSKNPDLKWINGWIADKSPHITLLYGLLESAHTWKNHINKVMDGWKMETVTIDHVDYFESTSEDEPYYCIVAHVKMTDELVEGHERLQLLPHVDTFVGYKPHMTICYIEKNEEERDQLIKMFNKAWAGKELVVKNSLNYGYKK